MTSSLFPSKFFILFLTFLSIAAQGLATVEAGRISRPAGIEDRRLLSPGALYEIIDGVRVIEDRIISDTVKIDGPEWNGGIIRNNVFAGAKKTGLHISNVRDLTIEGNEFFAIGSFAIKLRDGNNSGTKNVIISANYFHDLSKTAILVGEPNDETRILRNYFRNVATDTGGNKQHAIYIKGPGFLVEGNEIDGVIDAHGISVRTAGVVRGNLVKNVGEDGIKYYSSSMKTGDGRLIIENNLVYGNSHGGIAFDEGKGRKIDHVVVRFNTLVNNRRGIIVKSGLGDIAFDLYGNLIVESGGKYFSLKTNPRFLANNLTALSDIGFVDFDEGDFQLSEGSPARGTVKEVPGLPPYDFSGRTMGGEPYNPGAYQGTLPGRPQS